MSTENVNNPTATEGVAAPSISFSALMRVQREVLDMQQKAHKQSAINRRAGNSKDAAHYDTAAIILNEVASLLAEEVSRMNTKDQATANPKQNL